MGVTADSTLDFFMPIDSTMSAFMILTSGMTGLLIDLPLLVVLIGCVGY